MDAEDVFSAALAGVPDQVQARVVRLYLQLDAQDNPPTFSRIREKIREEGFELNMSQLKAIVAEYGLLEQAKAKKKSFQAERKAAAEARAKTKDARFSRCAPYQCATCGGAIRETPCRLCSTRKHIARTQGRQVY